MAGSCDCPVVEVGVKVDHVGELLFHVSPFVYVVMPSPVVEVLLERVE